MEASGNDAESSIIGRGTLGEISPKFGGRIRSPAPPLGEDDSSGESRSL